MIKKNDARTSRGDLLRRCVYLFGAVVDGDDSDREVAIEFYKLNRDKLFSLIIEAEASGAWRG